MLGGSRVSKSARPIIGYVCFAVVSSYLIFILPFRFPPEHRLLSASYIFGFNNSVALFGILALLGIATLLHLRSHRGSSEPEEIPFGPTKAEASQPMSPWIYWLMASLYFLLTLVLYTKARAAQFYGIDWESSHFLWRLKLMEIYGLRPYEDFHVDYGPALVYAPALVYRLLSPWGASHEASYYVCHYLMNLASLYCLFFLLNRSRIALPHKKISFVILAGASFVPYMGLNGVDWRFLMPYVSLLVIAQLFVGTTHHSSLSGSITLGVSILLATLTNASISPEIGLAFAVALVAFGLSAFRMSTNAGLSLLLALMIAILLCYELLPPAYYVTLLRFSTGANNLPLLPAAHIVLYLATLFFVIPPLLSGAIRRHDADKPLLMALGVLILMLVPGAVGRCDPPHVFFYGIGPSLLAFIQASRAGRVRFLGYAGAYILVFIIGWQWSNVRVFGGVGVAPSDFGRVVKKVIPGMIPPGTERGNGDGGRENKHQDPAADLADLSELDQYPSLGLPFGTYGTDKKTENYLWRERKIAPEYYVGGIGVYTRADLTRKIQDVSSNEYLLLLRGWNMFGDRDMCEEQLEYMRRSFVYPVDLACRRKGFDPDAEVSKYISNMYGIVQENGRYIVVRRSPRR